MNRHLEPDFDQRLADWLEDDPSTAPREVLGTVLAAYPSIDQRRASRVPWRFPAMNRYLLTAAAAALAVAIGAAFLAFRPPSQVGPPASPSAAAPSFAPATIEGTWDVSFTRQEMLAAGIVDQAEDNSDNYGRFHLTFQAGWWAMTQLEPKLGGVGTSTYTVDAGVAHLFAPADNATFDMPYTVTATSLTFGPGGPVTFRVKAWTRVATEVITATPEPALTPPPIKVGTYVGPTLQVADIVAAVNADTTLTPADRTQVLDVFLGATGKRTLSISIELRDGQLTQREALDGIDGIGSFGTYAFPDDHTLVYTERIGGADVVTVFELTVDGDSFTLHRTTPAHDAADEFVTRLIFESGPFVLQ